MRTELKYFGDKLKSELSVEEKARLKDYKDRFNKWHSRQIDLLTFLINLLFTITIATSGFIIANQDKELFKNKTLLCYSLPRTILFLLAISTTLGISALISRLFDFRVTKDAIKTKRRIYELDKKIKYNDRKPSNLDELESKKWKLKCWADFLGILTWILFSLQLLFFIVTLWTLIINV